MNTICISKYINIYLFISYFNGIVWCNGARLCKHFKRCKRLRNSYSAFNSAQVAGIGSPVAAAEVGSQRNQLLDLAVVGTLHKIKHWNLTNKNYTIKVTSNLLGSEPASNM